MQLHDNEQIDDDYLDGLREAALPGAKFAGMKIVLDCANGAASKLAPRLFRSLGADVMAMNDQPDGRNINAGCGSLHPAGDAETRGGNRRGIGRGVRRRRRPRDFFERFGQARGWRWSAAGRRALSESCREAERRRRSSEPPWRTWASSARWKNRD